MFKTTQTANKLPGESPHLKDSVNYDKTVIIQHMLQINPLFQLQFLISVNSAPKIIISQDGDNPVEYMTFYQDKCIFVFRRESIPSEIIGTMKIS